jgi:hypothetical protein
MKPEYCTQNKGKCETCSLVNYDLDCRNVPINENRKIKRGKTIEENLPYEPVSHDHEAFLKEALRREGFREAYKDLKKQ